MGYDCTLHLVDEEILKKEFVPRLLATSPPRTRLDKVIGRQKSWPPTSFDKRRRNAPQLWDDARTALKGDDPSAAARQICELGLLFISCELPYEPARGIALSLWPLKPAPFSPDIPSGLLGSPEEVLGDLVAAYPDLEGEFPDFFDGNGSPGAYIPAERVPSALEWVEAWLDTLEKGQRRHYIGLNRVLRVAAHTGYGYWEATDLDVEMVESDLLEIKQDRQPATLQVQKHVLPFPVNVGAGRSGRLIAVSDRKGGRTALFDLNAWPPRERASTGQYAISATQASDGRWSPRPAGNRPNERNNSNRPPSTLFSSRSKGRRLGKRSATAITTASRSSCSTVGRVSLARRKAAARSGSHSTSWPTESSPMRPSSTEAELRPREPYGQRCGTSPRFERSPQESLLCAWTRL